MPPTPMPDQGPVLRGRGLPLGDDGRDLRLDSGRDVVAQGADLLIVGEDGDEGATGFGDGGLQGDALGLGATNASEHEESEECGGVW